MAVRAGLDMVQHSAKWDHCSAGGTLARAKDQPPDTFLLMILNLVKVEPHIASLVSTFMLSILDHS